MSRELEGLATALDAYVRKLVAVAVATAVPQPEWYDQNNSPLTKRPHMRACRSGELDARKSGKLWLVHRDEMNRFIAAHGVPATRPAQKADDALDGQLRAPGFVDDDRANDHSQRRRTGSR